MMTNKALLEKYTKERASLQTQRDALDDRLSALDTVIGGLRQLTGDQPPKRAKGAGKATGTKALILDVLAGGERKSAPVIAEACKVTPSAVVKHLVDLIATGEVDRQGKSRATTYGIA